MEYTWRECKLVQPLWRTVWRVPKEMGIELPYDPAVPLLGVHPKEIRIKRDMYPNVCCSTIYNSAWKQPRCPWADAWIKKLWYLYTMGLFLSYKKEDNWVSYNKVDEPGLIISIEVSQKVKDKYYILMHIYGI